MTELELWRQLRGHKHFYMEALSVGDRGAVMTLPQASELDAYLMGWADALDRRGEKAPGMQALGTVHFEVLTWLRTNNDAALMARPDLPALERRYAAATTLSAKRDALRALLAARDAIIAAKPAHDAVQAQAVLPVQLGLHPTGLGGEE